MKSRLLAGIALATALVIVAAAPVAAATRPTRFYSLYLGQSCVTARSSDKVNVNFRWLSAKGKVKLALTLKTNKNGYWGEVCGSKLLKIGDRLKATVGSTTRTLKIPKLKIKINSTTDKIFGKAPPKSQVRVGWDGSSGEVVVNVNKKGRWSYTPKGLNIQQGFYAYARWTSKHNDVVTFSNVAF